MRVIVTGSRHWTDKIAIYERLSALPEDTIIVHGACRTGADALAKHVAGQLDLKLEEHPARPVLWQTFAQAARARNQAMADAGADLCLAFPLTGSKGTWDMVRRAKEANIPVEIVRGSSEQEARWR